MIQDNYGILSPLIKSKHAFFYREVMSGKAHYFAANRAARRIIKSNEFINLAKKNGLVIDSELMTVA